MKLTDWKLRRKTNVQVSVFQGTLLSRSQTNVHFRPETKTNTKSLMPIVERRRCSTRRCKSLRRGLGFTKKLEAQLPNRGFLEVLLTLALLIHGVKYRLPLGLVSTTQLVDFAFHLAVQRCHPSFKVFVRQVAQLLNTKSLTSWKKRLCEINVLAPIF